MTKLALLGAAAALMAPAFMTSASAQTASVTVGVGSPGYYRSGVRTYAYSPSHCRMVTVRTKHANGSVTIKKIRRCG